MIHRPRPAFSIKALCPIFLIGLLLVTASCDDTTVDPFENNGQFFTIYGYIDALETEHSVRVIPITRFPEIIESPSDDQATIDAVVTSTNLFTGQTTRWQHSLEKLSDDTYAHIFRASFLVQPGTPYRLEVRRSDGATATAETTVPFITEAARFRLDPVQISLDSVITQDVYMTGVPSPWQIESLYLMGDNLAGDEFAPIQSRFYVSYGRSGERTDDDGWHFRITISEDQASVRAEIDSLRNLAVYDPNSLLVLRSMGVRIRVLDENWDPPEGEFDPEVLAQPGTLSNVENGLGFWGSIGLYTQEWCVTDEFSMMLGYPGVSGPGPECIMPGSE